LVFGTRNIWLSLYVFVCYFCAVGTRSYLFPALLVSKAPDLLILPASVLESPRLLFA
jgi:hypothetical protein